MSTPQVPPRPQRSQAGPTEVKNNMPGLPPRPIRKTDPSPNREAYTRSPLNGPPIPAGARRTSQDHSRSSSELPRRPPSVSLPSVGQEGSEYSSYDQLPTEAHGVSLEASNNSDSTAAEQLKSVSPDLPMHQPVASVSTATAKRQIQTVTRTDSTQAAAAGIGKVPPTDDPRQAEAGLGLCRVTSRTNDMHPLRAKASFNRSTSSLHDRSTSRPASVHGGDHEHGIPEIGQQVPLLAYAGDVQAPSPGLGHSSHAPGIGFFNDGSTRHHNRKRSSRQEFHPPDVYGMRHDHEHQDQFERAWAAKHPEEAAREEHATHLPRPESAMSSEQLNRLVHQHSDIGFGTSPNVIGTPDEQIAFNASQEYMARLSGTPVALPERKKRPSSGTQPAVESPLRKTFSHRQHDHAMDSEDEQSYHLKPPTRKVNKVTGGGDADNKLNLGPYGEDGGYLSEHADSTPILASDEIIKRPGNAYMHAAVEPSMDRSADDYYDSDHGQWPSSRRNSMNPPSRPSSRPSSIHGNPGGYHGGSLHRYVSHEEHAHSGMGTPLAEIEEYEPLFPEDEKEDVSPTKAFKKRPDLASHHFPSQDVWEDNPASLEYSATVSTPELVRELESTELASGAASFETPAEEQARRDQNPASMASSSKTFVKPKLKAGVQDEINRPGVQRFPSSDVWEDSPDSFNLTTTVSGPQTDDSVAPDDVNASARPSIPARPEKRSALSQEVKPEAKPSIPARPVRAPQPEYASSDVPAPKAKPAVPSRPAGSKIAALQGNFLNDLNNRLKLGPQGPPPKKEEAPEEAAAVEKEPLADARKTRARGPVRRKPGASVEVGKKNGFAFSPLITVWTIDEEDEVQVQPASKPAAKESHTVEPAAAAFNEKKERVPSVEEANSIMASNEVQNTKEPVFSPPPALVGDGEDGALPEGAVGFEGDKPDPTLSKAAIEEQKAVQPEFEEALREAAEEAKVAHAA